MTSYLEVIPCDILQHIALLVAVGSSPSLGPPHDLLTLLLTSPTLHRSLCIKSCPHLYADIFRMKFDVRTISRRFNFQVTDSALAAELVARCRTLQRVKQRCFKSSGLRQDLWTAFWMVQESDGLNEWQLRHAGLAEFMLDITHIWDKHPPPNEAFAPEVRSLVVWLLCFMVTRQHILSLSPDARNALNSFLLPYSRNVHRSQPPSVISTTFLLSSVPWHNQMSGTNDTDDTTARLMYHDPFTHHQRQPGHKTNTVTIYAREWVPKCPDPNPAAINLIFCLKEVDPMAVPEHLPETRTIAIATQRFGPTKEDVRKIRGYRTTLFADTAPVRQTHASSCTINVRRSEWHDLESPRMVVQIGGGVAEVRPLLTMSGMLEGVWEGFYLTAGTFIPAAEEVGYERHHTIPDFICRKPLQSALCEFQCFSDECPKFSTPDDMTGLKKLPMLSSETEGGFEIDGHRYERLGSDSESDEQQPRRESRAPTDIVLLGETLEDHEQAWGGFRYAGRIRKDGSIILKRDPKEIGDDGLSGTWIFEGRLRFGTVFIGNWTSSSSSMTNVPCVQGIFSMQKRANVSSSW